MSAMLEAALEYAERDWPVFPLVDRGKAPRIPKSAGGKGYKDATTTGAMIRRWWTAWPSANIGIATGQGLAVIDIDPRLGDGEQFHRMCADYRWRPVTPEVHTGRGDGGRHLYFTCPLGLRGAGFARRRELELKADGGYVVAPPSIHESGRQYAWHPDRTPERGLEPLPRWVKDHLNGSERKPGRPRAAGNDPEATADFLKTIPPREYVEDLTGVRVPASGKIRCPAPGHEDRTPSFHVWDEPDRGWYCFGACKQGGSIYDFAALMAGLPVPCPRGAAFLRIEDWLLDFYTRKLRVE